MVGKQCSGRIIPEETLKKEVAEALGWERFDEERFLKEVEKVVVKEMGVEVQTVRL